LIKVRHVVSLLLCSVADSHFLDFSMLISSFFFLDIFLLLQPSGKTSISVNVHNLCEETDINQGPYLYF